MRSSRKKHRWTFIGSDEVDSRRCTSARTCGFSICEAISGPTSVSGGSCGDSLPTTWRGPLRRHCRPKIFHILWKQQVPGLRSDAPDSCTTNSFGNRVVLTAHTSMRGDATGPIRCFNRLTLKTQYRLADQHLCPYRQMKTELVQEFALRERQVTVSRTASHALPDTGLSPAAAIERLGIDRTARTILFFGSIALRLQYLVAAFQTIAARVETIG